MNHSPFFKNAEATLHLGDAFEVMPQLPAESVDMVITNQSPL